MIHKKKKNSEYKSCNTKNLIRYRQLCFYEHLVKGTFSQHFSGCLICLAGTIFKSNTLYFHTKLFKHHFELLQFLACPCLFQYFSPKRPFFMRMLYGYHSDELCELLLDSVPATHLKDELPGKPVSQLEGSAYQICNLATTVNLSYCEFSNVI